MGVYSRWHIVYKDPANPGFWNPPLAFLGTRMQDPSVCVVFGAAIEILHTMAEGSKATLRSTWLRVLIGSGC